MHVADEYCFLWLNLGLTSMNKAEWASWVQAIGSLIALGLTLHLACSGQRQQQNAATRAALLFACRLDLAVNRMLQATAWQVKT